MTNRFLLRPLLIHQAPVPIQEFSMAFAIDRMRIFEVEYATTRGWNFPKFTTSANHFNQNKSDYKHCGQGQVTICKDYPDVLDFFFKWDKFHLGQLTDKQYYLMRADLVALEQKYIHLAQFEPNINDEWGFSFNDLKELSMNVKRKK